jgi:hypothetical protein
MSTIFVPPASAGATRDVRPAPLAWSPPAAERAFVEEGASLSSSGPADIASATDCCARTILDAQFQHEIDVEPGGSTSLSISLGDEQLVQFVVKEPMDHRLV